MHGETFSVPAVSKGQAECFPVSRGSIASILPFYGADGNKPCFHCLEQAGKSIIETETEDLHAK